MHEGAYRFVAQMVQRIDDRHRVAELGSRTVAGNWPCSGPVRPLFTDARVYTGVDIAEGPNVDDVADAATWRPHPFVRFDTVVCCETLEHTDNADKICHNAWQLLDVHGVFLITTAGTGRGPHSAIDGGPLRDGEFYRNIDRELLRHWLWKFSFVLIDDTNPGDIYALAVK